eukprot:gene1513-2147_t
MSFSPHIAAYIGRPLHAAGLELMELLNACRDGLWLGAVKMADGAQYDSPGAQRMDGGRPEPPASSDSCMSFGSDLHVELWFQNSKWLDMEFVHSYVHLCMLVTAACKLPHAVLSLGSYFNDITDDHFAETLSPLLVTASQRALADSSRWMVLREQALRDKSIAQEALDNARALWQAKGPPSSLVAEGPDPDLPTTQTQNPVPSAEPSVRSEDVASNSARAPKGKDGAKQLTAIVAAYQKAMEVLQYRGEKPMLAQAQNELGDIYGFFGEWPQALTAWNDSVDTLTATFRTMKNCRALMRAEPGQVLEQYGLWGCLLAGTVFSKIAKYGYPNNLSLRLDACLTAATFFSGVFGCSFSHPQRALDFGEYVPTITWENANIWESPFRANLSDLLDLLHFISDYLLLNDRLLESLPVLALYEYMALHAARDIVYTVSARTLRVRALSRVGNLAGATRIIVDLLQGRRLPGKGNDEKLVLLDPSLLVPQSEVLPYNNMELPKHPANVTVAEYIGTAELPDLLAKMYGAQLVAEINVGRAIFLRVLGEVPSCWSLTDPLTGSSEHKEGAIPDAGKGESVGDQEVKALEMAEALLKGVVKMLLPPPPEKAEDGSEPEGPLPMRDQASAELLTFTYLQLAMVAQQRWSSRDALAQSSNALELLQNNEELMATVRMECPAKGGRLGNGLGGLLWCMANVRQTDVYLDMGHLELAKKRSTHVAVQMGAVSETWLQQRILLCEALCLAREGFTTLAIEKFGANLQNGRLCAGWPGSSASEYVALGLADLAAVKRRCGCLDEAESLLFEAEKLLRAVVEAHGQLEMQRYPELRSIYTGGVEALVKVLAQQGELQLLHERYEKAAGLLTDAIGLTHYTRTLPQLHAQISLLLARALRLKALPPPESHFAPIMEEEMAVEAATVEAHLERCITWGMLDGGHDLGTIRSALLESALLQVDHLKVLPKPPAAAVEVTEGADTAVDGETKPADVQREALIGKCLFFLQSVAKTSEMKVKLMETTQNLSGAITSTDSLPKWVKQYVAETEEYQESLRGVSPGGPTPTGRLLVEYYVKLVQTQFQQLMHADCTQARVAVLHRVMKSICSVYAAECCWSALPLFTEPAPALAAEYTAQLVYVIVPPAAADGEPTEPPLCGAVHVALPRVRYADSCVKAVLTTTEEQKTPIEEAQMEQLADIFRAVFDPTKEMPALNIDASVVDRDPTTEDAAPATPLGWDAAFLTKLEALLHIDSGLDIVDSRLSNLMRLWICQLEK